MVGQLGRRVVGVHARFLAPLVKNAGLRNDALQLCPESKVKLTHIGFTVD